MEGSHIKEKSGSNWRKAGIVRCSYKSEAVLIAVFEMGSYTWLVVDKKELLELLNGSRLEVDVKQHI